MKLPESLGSQKSNKSNTCLGAKQKKKNTTGHIQHKPRQRTNEEKMINGVFSPIKFTTFIFLFSLSLAQNIFGKNAFPCN
jgi:hypothetical protein